MSGKTAIFSQRDRRKPKFGNLPVAFYMDMGRLTLV